MTNIASAIVFVGMLYFAFTYSVWDWWVVAVLVLSFLGVGVNEMFKYTNKKENHIHYGDKMQ